MYYTNSKWKRFKNGLNNSNMMVYLIILLLLVVVIVVTVSNSGFLTDMTEHIDPQTASEESSGAVGDVENPSTLSYIAHNFTFRIQVNKSANFITIYKQSLIGESEEVFKTFRCSVNPSVETGTFETYEKNIWRKFNSGEYGQYSCRIAPDCYISSVPYYSQSSNALNADAYNNLGKPAKVGYIYLASQDAQWIYENCGLKTEVTVYDNPEEEPSIPLEEFVALTNNGYDPTDTSIDLKPIPGKIKYMTGVENHSIPVGTVYNLWEGIYAVDTEGNEITNYITVTGNVNTTVPGTYTIIYHLMDNYGTNLAYYSYVTVY